MTTIPCSIPTPPPSERDRLLDRASVTIPKAPRVPDFGGYWEAAA